MKRKYLVTIALIMVISFVGVSARAVPLFVNYQGSLVDKTTGNPVTDPGLPMTFRIYDAESGGNILWEEYHASVSIQDGIYNVLLGNGTTLVGSFDPALFSEDSRWLEIWVDGELFTPRQRLTSVAYAFTAVSAADADTVDGQHAEDFAASGHSHAFPEITGTASDGQIPNNITIDHAATADSATSANHATTADSATYAASAGSADYATNAGDADTVDGLEATAFAQKDGSLQTNLNADLLDGQHASDFVTSGHSHDHGSLTGLADDDHPQYFNLSQNETVSGRPAFNGGTAGSSPFTVDSSYRGASLNADYLGYGLPTILDLPTVDILLKEDEPNPCVTYGQRGVGEPPLVAGAPGINNAIYNAIGVSSNTNPVTPDKILKLLGKA